ncbi:MAG: hypothetical protein H6922_05705 [Pseudomonadaceae bacterium]|nr:hypothetical protein [Pseudomonadaceae bacterium]
MKLNTQTIFTLLLVAGLAMVGGDALATNGTTGSAGAGQTVLNQIIGAITGNIGLIIGLVLAILGIWTWVVKQETAAGIMLIIGGVLITVSPGVFNTLRSMVNPVVDAAASGYGGNANVQRNTQ